MKNKKIKKQELIVAIIYLLIAIPLFVISTIKIIKTKNFDAVSLETTLLLAVSLGYAFYRLLKNNKVVPTNIKGKELPIKKDKTSKQKRIKSYLFESLIFSIVVVALDLLSILVLEDRISLFMLSSNNSLNIALNSLITFGICMIIAFIFDYLIGELQVKRINKQKN